MNENSYLKKIVELTQQIVFKINMEKYKQMNLSYLQDSKFYFHIFTYLFGNSFLKERNNINYFMLDKEEQIQYLIDFLEDEILKIKIDHIIGKEIVLGNVKMIKEFLEILNQLIENSNEDNPLENNENQQNQRNSNKNSKKISSKKIIDKNNTRKKSKTIDKSKKNKKSVEKVEPNRKDNREPNSLIEMEKKKQNKTNSKKKSSVIKNPNLTENKKTLSLKKKIIPILKKKKDLKTSKNKKSPSQPKTSKSKKRNLTSHFFKKRNPELVIEQNPSSSKKSSKPKS